MSKWEDIYLQQLALDPDFNLVTPIEPLPGEAVEDTAIRYWLEQEILTEVAPEEFEVNLEKAMQVDPNIAKFLEASQQAEFQDILDFLEQDGYIYSSVDSDGNIVYGLTPEGKIYFETLQAEGN